MSSPAGMSAASAAPDVQQCACRMHCMLCNQVRDMTAVVSVLIGGIAPHWPQPCQVRVKTTGIVHHSYPAERHVQRRRGCPMQSLLGRAAFAAYLCALLHMPARPRLIAAHKTRQ